MVSPVTKSSNVTLKGYIDVEHICKLYREHFNINVKNYFGKEERLAIYECDDTGYCFYYPFSVAGEEELYSKLQEFDFYYLPDKWEFDQALKFISPTDNVLEIGCGDGAFLLKAQQITKQVTGIELNELAQSKSQQKELTVFNKLLSDFTQNREGEYDVICAFQVLEHIWDVGSFIGDAVKLLKPKGKLIIGVPNNGSYRKYYYDAPLNYPPHHMGLWNRNSLKNITKYFPIKLIHSNCESLPSEQISLFVDVYGRHLLTKNIFMGKCYYKAKGIILPLIHLFRPMLSGHTIMSVYEKK